MSVMYVTANGGSKAKLPEAPKASDRRSGVFPTSPFGGDEQSFEDHTAKVN